MGLWPSFTLGGVGLEGILTGTGRRRGPAWRAGGPAGVGAARRPASKTGAQARLEGVAAAVVLEDFSRPAHRARAGVHLDGEVATTWSTSARGAVMSLDRKLLLIDELRARGLRRRIALSAMRVVLGSAGWK